MPQQRRNYRSQDYYIQNPKPYLVKKRPISVLLRFILAIILSITLLTGGAIRSDIDVLADVFPDIHELPPLVEYEINENEVWTKNLVPPIENAIYMAWDYNPLYLNKIPPGVNVLAPTWFYIEADPVTGVATAKNLLQMGKTEWNPQQYVELCHANGVKVWGVLSSFVDPSLAEQIVTNMEVQQQVINQLVEWTRAYRLDGISLDFEKMNPENKDLFTAFAKNIKDALPANQNTVSAAVTVKLSRENPNNWYQCYDRGGLAQVIDYVAVMTYEGHKSGDLAPIAGIEWVETHIQRLLEEMPSDKLLMGVPFYGVDFISRVTDTDSFDVELLWKDDSDYRINFYSSNLQSALANGEYDKGSKTIKVSYWLDKGSWNDSLGVAQYSYVDTENLLHTVYIDNESSLYQKGTFAQRYNLAGVGIWREGFGYDEMWEALADGLS